VRGGIPALVTLVVLLAFAFFLVTASGPVLAQEGIFEQDKLTGDWGGLRKTLKDTGIDLGVNDTSEMLSNPVGGI
jgi:carbohydrate-selective porin OprB